METVQPDQTETTMSCFRNHGTCEDGARNGAAPDPAAGRRVACVSKAMELGKSWRGSVAMSWLVAAGLGLLG
ncbi:MAG TPA: hypothetical protein VH853_20775, partial [Polyangia bacterium]|nr:hypothetical protein [Polyangia bacterium]